MSEYDVQAKEFLEKTKTTITKKFVKYGKHFGVNDADRNIRAVTIENQYSKYTFNYGDSVVNSEIQFPKNFPDYLKTQMIDKGIRDKQSYKENSHKLNLTHGDQGRILKLVNEFGPKEPSDYAILSCLSVFDGELTDFCSSYGYDEDSISANKIYKAVIKESNSLRTLFDRAELEMLQEI